MPQKRNPDPMELARGKAGRLLGNLVGLLTTLKGLPSGYNKDLQEDKEPLFDTYHTLLIMLPVLSQMVAQLTFNQAKLHAAFDENMLATELADWLVLEKGLPFREAHHIIGQVVQTAEQRQVTLSQLSLADYQAISSLFDETLYQELDFDHAVRKRRVTGGTSPEAVAQQIELAKQLIGMVD
jgi:argininosuccinate lyase